jgi:chromosome segregation ATPase
LENALKEVTENIVANTQKALNSKQEKLDQLDAALDSWIKLADERFKLIRGKNDKILALEAETRRWSEAEKETARKHQEQCSLYVGRIQELEGILESKQNLVSAAGLYQGRVVELETKLSRAVKKHDAYNAKVDGLKRALKDTLLRLDEIYSSQVGQCQNVSNLRVDVQAALNRSDTN